MVIQSSALLWVPSPECTSCCVSVINIFSEYSRVILLTVNLTSYFLLKWNNTLKTISLIWLCNGWHFHCWTPRGIICIKESYIVIKFMSWIRATLHPQKIVCFLNSVFFQYKVTFQLATHNPRTSVSLSRFSSLQLAILS